MYYIGVDLGGTNIAAGIVTEEGKLIKKKSIPTLRHRNYQEILKDMGELCLTIIKEEGISLNEVASVGVGSPGTPDPENGILVYANNLKFKDVPIRTELQKYINVPVYLENDANCAALGEAVAGAAKGYKNSVTVTLGTGVGGGIILDGKIFSGSFYGGGEIGHHVIVADGEPCTCGRKGCWETYASATALIREARIAVIRNPESGLAKLVGGDINLINAKVPFDAAQSGDPVGQELIDNYIKYLGMGIANVINIIQPEIVVIGGGVCAQGDNLLNPLKEIVKKNVYQGTLKTELRIAELGNDAGIIGAAMLGK
ncbi:MAG: glucokinase [Epulopiscium sp.]|jgi:glucokinase|uniref:ROK family protein n=1 Tax=Defluviitalea raffinosedens TaxID=1450156 RepID=A0A7C8LK06_9FIRM|nr:ROK family protein [Defluviitalea raffinosedens]MBZ4667492.1 glucokinase, family [Defluviitaleaceae bacterium]MDK2787344.1 glucokinase [Candidatus Epulonipiscium sp.]KAE9635488.1 ROK family protein [Defluviitalea raffinosedens]MBM7684398.1 glucokinase [Defluviitalea raffinosedens]HHW68495.1 ROK family protein [Candidatus Epulonipiscium sp.]